MDGGAWWAAVHGVTKSQTRLSDFTFTFHFHALEKEMATHSGVLAWRIPGTAEPGGLLSAGSHRVRHDWSDLAAAAVSPRNICILDVSSNFPNFKQQSWETEINYFIEQRHQPPALSCLVGELIVFWHHPAVLSPPCRPGVFCLATILFN